MENGSKALLMAAGMLIAIVIVTLIVIVFNNIGSFYSSADNMQHEEQTSKVNLEFEAYNRNNVKGIELVTLLNKIKDYNNNYKEEGYNIKTNIDNLIEYNENNEIDSEFKGKTFKCNRVHYNLKTGRIDEIYFQ